MVAYIGVDVYSKDKMNLLWIEDFPLFLPKEDGSEGLLKHHLGPVFPQKINLPLI